MTWQELQHDLDKFDQSVLGIGQIAVRRRVITYAKDLSKAGEVYSGNDSGNADLLQPRSQGSAAKQAMKGQAIDHAEVVPLGQEKHDWHESHR